MVRRKLAAVALSLAVVVVAQLLSALAARSGILAPPIMLAVIIGIATASLLDVADVVSSIHLVIARTLQVGVVLLALGLPALSGGQFPTRS